MPGASRLPYLNNQGSRFLKQEYVRKVVPKGLPPSHKRARASPFGIIEGVPPALIKPDFSTRSKKSQSVPKKRPVPVMHNSIIDIRMDTINESSAHQASHQHESPLKTNGSPSPHHLQQQQDF